MQRPDALNLQSLEEQLSRTMLRDRHRLARRLHGLRATSRHRNADAALAGLAREIERSHAEYARRLEALPRPTYPQDLPVVEKREEIKQAIAGNQVIVLCGETGSGKTTQLPKICLELGRGVAGMIGHTQPRRIAARSVAMRLAQELQTSVGHAVGYKIRFTDHVSPQTYVKLMTDGILLAETQQDRFLNAYDTIIIDEAHERSLNIDFLLGYLHRLLPKRPELKLIITSATIDPERFSKHFGNAPILMVSGRTYPVEIRYRSPMYGAEDVPETRAPLDPAARSSRRAAAFDIEEELDLERAILDAVDELRLHGPGDILVFLPGEREIREAAESLRKHHPPGVEILPLYARLSADEQMRIFAPHDKPRIVLATNVAETTLTVPGIKYVIDTGTARISRYNPRTKVQRLPIEKISQASAAQRAGRCGRVAPGIAIRLYTQEDFDLRPPYTEPEIQRTTLAAVILQMKAFNLGEIEEFPFIDPPDQRQIRDGYQTLHELGAIDDENHLTPLGRKLARLPVDPRIARMILAGAEERVLDDVLIIAAALSVQDPRDRPMDKAELADQAHAQWRDNASDFLGLLKLWRWYHEQSRHLSQNKLRKLCQDNFLGYMRMREWHDVHGQLKELVGEMGLR
jgi:ATP-dependent helicase HrpA